MLIKYWNSWLLSWLNQGMQEKRVLKFLKFRKHLRYKGTQGGTNVSYSYLNMHSLGLNGLIECRLLNIFELVFVQSGWCGMECGFVYILFYNLQLQYAWWELLLCSWGSIIPRPLLTSWTFPLIPGLGLEIEKPWIDLPGSYTRRGTWSRRKSF